MAVTDSFAGGVLTFTGDGADDTLEITSLDATGANLEYDLGAGVVSRAGVISVSFDGGAGTNSLLIIGSAGNDAIDLSGTTANYAAVPFALTNVQNLAINGQDGQDTLSATGGSVTGNLDLLGGADDDVITIDSLTTGELIVTEGDAGAVTLLNAVTTSGGQIYNDPVTLGADTTLIAGTDVTFASTLDGGFSLTAIASGAVTFNGAVGGLAPLATLTTSVPDTDINGGLVNTLGDQVYNSAVTLGADTTLNAGANVIFVGAVDGAVNLTAVAPGSVLFNGAVGGLDPLASLTTASASATINGGIVNTLGDQVYNSAVTLGADTTLSAGANVIFVGAVDGAFNLNILPAGIILFNGAVGGLDPLASLFIIATDTTISGGMVNTILDQTYNSPVTLAADATLFASSSNLTFGGAVDGGFNLSLIAAGNVSFFAPVGSLDPLATLTVSSSVTVFNGGVISTLGDQIYNSPVILGVDATLNSGANVIFGGSLDGALNLSLSAAVGVFFNGAVGATDPLASLTVTAAGTTISGGLVDTLGDQFYTSDITLAADTILDAGGNVIVVGALDGGFVLSVIAAANVIFAGPVGGVDPLATLTTNASAVAIDGGLVVALGSQVYNNPVTVGADATLDAGGFVIFAGSLDGGFNLNISAGVDSIFNGAVGGLDPLASLTVTAANIGINGGGVSTLGAQTYNGPVTLGTDTTLNVGGNLDFASTVDGPFSVIATVTGITTLGGAVGGITPLMSLALLTGGPLTINQNITTTDFITLTVNEGAIEAAGDDITVGGPGGPATLTTIDVLIRAGDNVELADNSAIIASASVSLQGDVFGDNDTLGSLITISGAISATSAMVFTGNGDDLLTINETAPGQLNLTGTSPAAHTNTAFGASGLGPTNVGLHFDAFGGVDSLAMNFSLSHDVAYFSDNVPGDPNSGVINVAGAFTLSFDSLAPIVMVGAGGTLLVDASSTPATTTLTVSDDAVPGDGVSQVTGNGGIETTTFSGFNALIVRGGDGSETITLVSADPADPDSVGPGEALTAITLDGDNITFTDTANDFLLVQSLPASIAAVLLGGQGDDVFLLDSNGFAAGGTLDLILGSVIVIGEGNDLLSTVSITTCGVTKTLPLGDRLLLVDADSASDNTYALSDATFQRTALLATGLVTYSSIERVDLLAGSGSDTIDVSSTISDGTTIISPNGGDNIVTVAATGNNSILFVDGSANADTITLQSTGTDSAILLDGGSGNDAINVEATAATTLTQLNGGSGDDTFTLGSPANTLDGLQGTVCVFGEGQDGSLGLNPTLIVCGVDRTLSRGDLIVFNDQAGPAGSTYTLTDGTLARTGIATITYETIETVVLNTADVFADIIDVTNTVPDGTTIVNSGGGDDVVTIATTGDNSNLQVNAGAGADTITLQNSGANGAVELNGEADNDAIIVSATGAASLTELNGGDGDDTFTLGSPANMLDGLQGTICVFGEAQDGSAGLNPTLLVCGVDVTLARGDLLVFNDQAGPAGSTYTLTDGTLARTGVTATITYETTETVVLNTTTANADVINVTTTAAGATTIINSDGGADAITITTTGAGSNLQVNAGAGGDTITLQNNGASSAVELNGEAGNDFFNVFATDATSLTELNGGDGDDLFLLDSNGFAAGGTLDGLQGLICVFGEDNDLLSTVSLTACGVTKTLTSGDRLLLVDSDSASDNAYALSDAAFQRTGLLPTGLVTYSTIERVDLLTGTGNDTIDVSSTISDGTTIISPDGGDDVVTVAATGSNSILFVDGSAGADTITLQSTGTDSAILLDGDAGNDAINVHATDATTLTQLNGGTGDDTFTLGSPANTPDGLQGTVCVFGEGQDGSLGLNPTLVVCGVDRTLSRGDLIMFNDQAGPAGSTYTLTDGTLARTGIATITYETIETVVLNTADVFADIIDVTNTVAGGTTIINSGGGDDVITVATTGAASNLQVNAGAGVDTVTLQDSGAASAVEFNGGTGNDALNVWRTAAASLTEINGQDGDDTITLGTPASEPDSLQLDGLQGEICVFGGDPIADSHDGTAGLNPTITVCGVPFALLQRDRLIFNDQDSAPPHTYSLDPTSLTRDGLPAPLTFVGIETVELNTTDPLTPPAPPTPADTILVTGTGPDTTTVVNAGAGDDAITIAGTGAASILQVNAGAGLDTITLQNTGVPSVVELNGGTGNDVINVFATGAGSLTELNGGDGDDTFTLGSPANMLDGLQGTICVFGEGQDGSLGLNPPLVVCGVSRTLARGDLLTFNDQGGPAGSTYTLGSNSLTRTGVGATITFETTETVVLNTTAANADDINVTGTAAAGTTIINLGGGNDSIDVGPTGADSNLQVNAGAGLDTFHLVLAGGANSAIELNGEADNDGFLVESTAATSLTELNGGAGDDTFVLGQILGLAGLQGTICVFGDGQDGSAGLNPPLVVCGVDRTLPRGDQVEFNDIAGSAGNTYTLTDGSVSRTGVGATITYETVETVVLATTPSGDIINVTNTLPAGTTIIRSNGGDDTITIATTGADSNLQVDAGPGADTVTLQNSGTNSAVEINGDAGNDAINVWATGATSLTELNGGDGDDAFTLGSPANTLNGLQGTICVFGQGQDGTAGSNPPFVVCGVDRTLARGDLLTFNDQAGPAGSTYTLTDVSLARTGVSANITFETIETLELNTTVASADLVDVQDFVPLGTTIINTGGGDDHVSAAPNGAGNLQVNAGDGNDSATIVGGPNSAIEINGGAGIDVFNVLVTGPGSLTELNGGAGDDNFQVGPPPLPAALQGEICVFGEGEDGLGGLNPPLVVCGVDRTLPRGDRLTFNDFPIFSGQYTLTDASLTRVGGGAVSITYETVETVILNVNTFFGATINVTNTVAGGTTIINSSSGGDVTTIAATGANSNLQVNGGGTITLQNSGVNSAVELNGLGTNDTANVWATGAASLTELNGGGGDDTFTLGSPTNTLNGLQGTICVFGDGQNGSAGLNPPLVVCEVDRALPRGDQLVFNDQSGPAGSTYTLTDGTLARTGLSATITYATTETVVLNTTAASADIINVTNTVAGGTTVVNSSGGDDTINIATTGAASNLQVNAGAGNDTFNVFNTGAGSASQLNGEGGVDTFNIRGTGAGSDTQINAGDDHDQINIGSPAPYPTGSPLDQLARNALDEASATDATSFNDNFLGMVCVNGGGDCDELFIRGSVLADNITIGAPGSGAAIEVAQTECISVFTGAGDDTVSNNTFVRSLISGGPGDDMLTGGSGADLIFGGSGADTINGGPGDDFLFSDQDSTGQLTPEPPPAAPGTFSGGDVLIGGGGTDNAVSIGVGDLLINVTGMIVEEAATKNVLTFLRAQFMAFTPANVQALFDKGIVTRCECGPDSAMATAGLYNPATGAFFLRNDNAPGPADETFVYGAGGLGYIALAGDWDGDGHDTPGLYNPANGAFFLRNTNGGGLADWSFAFGPGGPGWQPIAGDWDGDGIDTVGLYNVASSAFFLRNTHAAGPADLVYSFGPAGSGWTPLAGDWNGDLIDTVGLYNPATGGFFLRDIHAPGIADQAYTFGPGGLGWKPIAGDWNSDGIDTVGVQNPATSTFFLRNVHAAGPADVAFAYGPPGAGWMPLAGDWNGSEGSPLRLAAATAASGQASGLDPADAGAAADAAMARWAVAGLSEASLDRLAGIDVQVTDLPGDKLGMAMHGTIYIDRDAAGRGWFVDPTPADDEEFTPDDGQLRAHAGPAHDRADLLSVLIHELGHELGLDHVDSDASAADVMAETIALGTRRVPTPQLVDRIFGEE